MYVHVCVGMCMHVYVCMCMCLCVCVCGVKQLMTFVGVSLIWERWKTVLSVRCKGAF